MKKSAYTRGISIALKVAIVSLAAWYIARRISSQPDPEAILHRLALSFGEHPFRFTAVLLLMPVNWLLEALKWKMLVASRVKLSLREAFAAVLAGVTTGTATPNRIGEFAGRIFMTREGDRLGLLLFSFVASFCQVGVTVLAGIWGLLMNRPLVNELSETISHFDRLSLWLVLPLLAGGAVFLLYLFKRNRHRFPGISAGVFMRTFGTSALRYFVYVLQFVLLLSMVNAHIDWLAAFSGVTVCYLLVTIIPTFSITEMLVRGSVASLVFSGTPMDAAAFYVAMLLWLINVAVPSLAGTIFVFRLKFFRSE